jgi:four helix bundle protein
MQSFSELRTWQLGMRLAKAVYGVVARLPQSERFELSSQLRRAAVSVPSNIAEGHARYSDKDFQRFLRMARGSLAELQTQLLLAVELGYVDRPTIREPLELADHESRMLTKLIASLEKEPSS